MNYLAGSFSENQLMARVACLLRPLAVGISVELPVGSTITTRHSMKDTDSVRPDKCLNSILYLELRKYITNVPFDSIFTYMMLDCDITVRESISYSLKYRQFFSRKHNRNLASQRADITVAQHGFSIPQFLLARNEVQQRRRDRSKCL